MRSFGLGVHFKYEQILAMTVYMAPIKLKYVLVFPGIVHMASIKMVNPFGEDCYRAYVTEYRKATGATNRVEHITGAAEKYQPFGNGHLLYPRFGLQVNSATNCGQQIQRYRRTYLSLGSFSDVFRMLGKGFSLGEPRKIHVQAI